MSTEMSQDPKSERKFFIRYQQPSPVIKRKTKSKYEQKSEILIKNNINSETDEGRSQIKFGRQGKQTINAK